MQGYRRQWDRYPSCKNFEDIVKHFNREAKMFFRIIVRKGMNRILLLDDKKQADLIDIVAHDVRVADKEYFINCYLSSSLLVRMKRRFALTEQVRY